MNAKTKSATDVSTGEAVDFLVEQGFARGAAVVIVNDQAAAGAGRVNTRFLIELIGARLLDSPTGAPPIERL